MKMSRLDRAKQFMPFSPLDGYSNMISDNKKVFVERKELTEEQAEYLSRQINAIKKGDIVTVRYYKDGEYIDFTGMVSNIDCVFRRLTLVKTVIPFDDLLDIKR